MAGIAKMTTALPDLAEAIPWVNDLPAFMVRLIGLAEFLAGVGLIMPGVLQMKPEFIPKAALGLVVIMLLAMIYHIVKGEFNELVLNLVLGMAAAFIVWGRSKKIPIRSKY